jgi:hypothetical protein
MLPSVINKHPRQGCPTAHDTAHSGSGYRRRKVFKKTKTLRAEESYSSASFVSSLSTVSSVSTTSGAVSGIFGREIVSFMTTSLISG